MRRTMSLAVVLLLTSSVVAAQEPPRFRLFAGLEQPGAMYNDTEGLDLQAGYVLGLDTYLTPRLALEFAASYQSESFDSASGAGFSLETSSLDAATRFDLLRRGRWSLHGLGGVRYTERRNDLTQLDLFGNPTTARFADDRTGILLGLGLGIDLTDRFALRLDAKHVPWTLTGDERLFEDTTLSTLVGFKF